MLHRDVVKKDGLIESAVNETVINDFEINLGLKGYKS
jgi:hypothetical protein